jgi:hypothetical protein
MTLTDFLLARIAEDEAAARATTPGPWNADEHSGVLLANGEIPTIVGELDVHDDAAHIARHDPARVLAQCAAYREIVELHRQDEGPIARKGCRSCLTDRSGFADEWEPDELPCPTLRALASMWAGHPEFDPEWRLG